MINIRQATSGEADWLQSSFDTLMGWTKPSGYFETCCQLQAQGEIIAMGSTDYLGHCTIVWQPHYPHFRDQNISEIQDLNVRPDYRRQGIATQLLDEAERRIQRDLIKRASALVCMPIMEPRNDSISSAGMCPMDTAFSINISLSHRAHPCPLMIISCCTSSSDSSSTVVYA